MDVYLNGNFKNLNDAHISTGDRGFVFGDGVYEVVRVVDGNFFMEKEHLERMDEGLEGLKINLEASERKKFPDISRELLKRNGHLTGEATVYIQITRGAAHPRTHTFPDPPVPPTVYMATGLFKPHTELHRNGVDAITLADVRWTRCNLKTVNLLPNILAKQQAKEAGVNSALLIRDGVITESPNANIFGVKNGRLQTYPVSNYILNGITRRVVLSIAEELKIPVDFTPIRQEELHDMEEYFFSGTTTDIQPVTEVDGKAIGTGKPGPVTKRIQKGYQNRLYLS